MRHRAPVLLALLLVSVITDACNKDSGQKADQTVVAAPVSGAAKRYHLKGKVVSIDKQSKMLNVDGEDIPNFMPAMTMPYEVKPESELDKLKPGDTITADVVVQDDKGWLENIIVTGHPAPSTTGKSQ